MNWHKYIKIEPDFQKRLSMRGIVCADEKCAIECYEAMFFSACNGYTMRRMELADWNKFKEKNGYADEPNTQESLFNLSDCPLFGRSMNNFNNENPWLFFLRRKWHLFLNIFFVDPWFPQQYEGIRRIKTTFKL